MIHINKRFLLLSMLVLNLLASSCSSSSVKKPGTLPEYSVSMNLEDKSGSFLVKRSSGLTKSKKSLYSKYEVFSEASGEAKVLEQAVVMATPGYVGKNLPVLRPFQSRYKVWFDGKLYQTETKIDVKNRTLRVAMESPEKQWSGRKDFIFPGGNGIFCYFSQLVECISFTGFIKKAISQKKGKTELTVIWDGYPYIQEQYLNLKNEPFAPAVIEYDGSTKEGDHRFSLNISGSVIFYLFNENYEYAKIFWPAQGYSLYHR